MISVALIFDIPSQQKVKIVGIWGAITLAFFMGFADDTFNTQPVIKFSAQVLCALILLLTGTHIQLFEIKTINYFLTIFWVVGMMNSINMLDNMDGIAGSISLYILIFCSLIMFFIVNNTTSPLFLMFSGVAVGLASFLIFNFNPAKMFMGDTGSQFLGVILSIAGIEAIWNTHFAVDLYTHTFLSHLLIVALVFIIPLIDTTTVTINRLLKGNSPFIGGKDHTTHFLCKRGFSEKQVFIIFLIIILISYVLAFQLIYHLSYSIFYLSLIYVVCVFTFLYLNTRVNLFRRVK